MGWLFTSGASRRDIIAERIKRWSNDGVEAVCLKHAVRGNVLWTVWEHRHEDGRTTRFIGCDLLQCKKDCGWGYKDMDESCHPYYFTCPLSFLDMVPPSCEPWRAKVRAYHARMNAGRHLTVGQVVKLRGCTIPEILIISVRPLRGRHNGITYRLRRSDLDLDPEQPPMAEPAA
ncbi:MAG: hypothetical protein AB1411_02400 [Nitrospirota bacterium]